MFVAPDHLLQACPQMPISIGNLAVQPQVYDELWKPNQCSPLTLHAEWLSTRPAVLAYCMRYWLLSSQRIPAIAHLHFVFHGDKPFGLQLHNTDGDPHELASRPYRVTRQLQGGLCVCCCMSPGVTKEPSYGLRNLLASLVFGVVDKWILQDNIS